MKKLGIVFLDFLVISMLVYIFLFVFAESHYLDRISENRRTAARVVTWGYCIATALYIFIAHRQSLVLTALAGILAYLSLGVAISQGFTPFIFFMIVGILTINLIGHFITRYKVSNKFLAADFEDKKTLFSDTNPIPLAVDLSFENLKELRDQSFNIGSGKGTFKILQSFEHEDELIFIADSFWERVLILFDINNNSIKIQSFTGSVDYQIKKGFRTGIERKIRIFDKEGY